MIENQFSEEETRVLDGYVTHLMEDIWEEVDDTRCKLADRLVESLHDDAHWIPKAGCEVPDGRTIMSLDSKDRDLITDYFLVKVCKEIISHCEESITHIQDDHN